MTGFDCSRLERLIRPIAVYHGKGNLFIGHRKQGPECEFVLTQWPDAKIQLQCIMEDSPAVVEKSTNLQGKTRDGRFVRASLYPLVCSSAWSSAGKCTCRFLVKALTVEVPRLSASINQLEFLLTNFKLPANIILQVNDRKITIKRVTGYNEICDMLREFNGIDVTSEAIVETCKLYELDELEKLMDEVCLLLSLASGTTVQWICYKATTNDGDCVRMYHRSVVTKPYTSLRLIPSDSVKSFVEQTLQEFKRQNQKRKMGTAILLYLDAKSEQDYLELRGLKLASLAEFLKAQLKLKGNFKPALQSLCTDLGLTNEQENVDRFVKNRDKLVHAARFCYDDACQEYRFMMTFMGKILLAMLRYNGDYLDWTVEAEWESDMRKPLELEKE